MNQTLHALIVEDSESDAGLVIRLLRKAGYDVFFEQVQTAEEMTAALARQVWDVVISDYSLPRFDAPTALALLQETGQDIPFIVVSGTIGEDTAVTTMKAGAHDYLMKDNLLRLAPAVAREMREAQSRRERKQAQLALQKSERDYRQLSEFNRHLNNIFISFNEAPDLATLEQIIAESYSQLTGAVFTTISRYDAQSKVLQVAATAVAADLLPQIEALLGFSLFDLKMAVPDYMVPNMTTYLIDRTEDLGALSFSRIPPETAEKLMTLVGAKQIIALGLSYGSRLLGTMVACLPDGRAEIPDHALKTFAYMASLAIARKEGEESLRASETRFSTIFHASPVGICLTRLANGQIIDANAVFLEILGYSREEVLKNHTQEMGMWAIPEDRHKVVQLLHEQGRILNIELKLRRKSGEIGETLVSAELIELAGERYILSMIQDITERKRDEAEKEKLQAQLVQAQKMESVGRLAGGVAHDFNNMLSVMMLHAEIGLSQLEPKNKLYDNLQEIYKATQHSADLTHQLLAFARKQLVAPKVLNLNETIETMLKMLRRLIGADITLVWTPTPDVWSVKMDPSQIDQILVNLCVNARDAIIERGKIIIETQNVVFDDLYCTVHTEAVPGKFVLLSISDDGLGMDQETQRMLFEPFFTTKELGKGTGLGLATVYGIVKQNNGFIAVYSEPGLGTTFKIYLPYHGDPAERVEQENTLPPLERGNEVVLVVEDEAAILDVIATTLRTQGYTVLTAVTPHEALHLIQDYTGKLDLLVTDMIMPKMNGRDLAHNLLSSYPHLKVVYMSGYTANVIAQQGTLDEQVCFIQKPFSIREISLKVREALDRTPPF